MFRSNPNECPDFANKVFVFFRVSRFCDHLSTTPRVSVFPLDREQNEWAESGVLTNFRICQIVFLTPKFYFFSRFSDHRHPDFMSSLSIGSRINMPNGGDGI